MTTGHTWIVAALFVLCLSAACGKRVLNGDRKGVSHGSAPPAPAWWVSEPRLVRAVFPGGERTEEITYWKNAEGMEFVWIVPGEFTMGGDPLPDEARLAEYIDWDRTTHPKHRVRLTVGFFMSATEVTQAQWEQVMGSNPSWEKMGGDLPVDSVSWNDVSEFCSRLTAQEGIKYDLPREAEWEYACRAGTNTPFNTGGSISTKQANYDGRDTYRGREKGVNRMRAMPVKSFLPNRWGLYDMHGNLIEWCADYYAKYPRESREDPVGPPDGKSRVLRSGAYNCPPWYCRSSHRLWAAEDASLDTYGCRIVVRIE